MEEKRLLKSENLEEKEGLKEVVKEIERENSELKEGLKRIEKENEE